MKLGIRHSVVFLISIACFSINSFSSANWKFGEEVLLGHPDSPWVILAIADANLGKRYERIKDFVQQPNGVNIHLISIDKSKSISRMKLYSPFEKNQDGSSVAQKLYKHLTLHIDSIKQKHENLRSAAFFGHSLSGLFGSWVSLQSNCPFDVVYLSSPSCWVNKKEITRLGDSSVYAKTHILVGGMERLNLVFHSSRRYAKRNRTVVFSSIPFRGHASTVSRGFRDLLDILNLT
jgi:hypothetical protein